MPVRSWKMEFGFAKLKIGMTRNWRWSSITRHEFFADDERPVTNNSLGEE